MMGEVEDAREALVRCLVDRLERNEFRYAVLRNYERFPAFNNDCDLVMDSSDVARFRQLAAEVAAGLGWDVVCECRHWARSPVAQHRIDVFRFYKLNPLACFQVDLFHGYVLWGTALFSEGELLAGRVRSNHSPFTQIDPVVETMFRLLQAHREGRRKNDGKAERHAGRALEHLLADHERVLARVQATLGRQGARALFALMAGDQAHFVQSMKRAKIMTFGRRLARRPLQTMRDVWYRVFDWRRLNISSPCGLLLRAYVPSEAQRLLLSDAMERLVASGAVYEWVSRDASSAKLSVDERRVMERSGIVIHWDEASDHADVRLTAEVGELSVIYSLLRRVVERDEILYASEMGRLAVSA